jgi:hypothetical protein
MAVFRSGMHPVLTAALALGLACTRSHKTALTPVGDACQGTRTVVVHNGTADPVEVVTGVGGVSLGHVAEIVEPGRASQPMRAQAGGFQFLLRNTRTGAVVDTRREPRLRLEEGCAP